MGVAGKFGRQAQAWEKADKSAPPVAKKDFEFLPFGVSFGSVAIPPTSCRARRGRCRKSYPVSRIPYPVSYFSLCGDPCNETKCSTLSVFAIRVPPRADTLPPTARLLCRQNQRHRRGQWRRHRCCACLACRSRGRCHQDEPEPLPPPSMFKVLPSVPRASGKPKSPTAM